MASKPLARIAKLMRIGMMCLIAFWLSGCGDKSVPTHNTWAAYMPLEWTMSNRAYLACTLSAGSRNGVILVDVSEIINKGVTIEAVGAGCETARGLFSGTWKLELAGGQLTSTKEFELRVVVDDSKVTVNGREVNSAALSLVVVVELKDYQIGKDTPLVFEARGQLPLSDLQYFAIGQMAVELKLSKDVAIVDPDVVDKIVVSPK